MSLSLAHPKGVKKKFKLKGRVATTEVTSLTMPIRVSSTTKIIEITN